MYFATVKYSNETDINKSGILFVICLARGWRQITDRIPVGYCKTVSVSFVLGFCEQIFTGQFLLYMEAKKGTKKK